MHHLYILFSDSLNKFYVGHTSDLSERIERHNRGGDKFIQRSAPGILFTLKNFQTKEEAYKREREIKNWKNKIMIQKLIRSAG
ncbi:MAG: GIY-YIG nuclease family protein [Crocinitomicaceae bacterium]|nr:GIY-YIG nuclease family protein [Crocinitomicaceae bacterium]